jgi:Rod binding domain-containing protein
VSGVDGLGLTSAPVAVPADIRQAGAEAEQTYRAALGFERSLLEQLTKTMAPDADGSDAGDDADGASAATAAYRDMLPGTLADAVTGAGGLGLAHDLFVAMRSAS